MARHPPVTGARRLLEVAAYLPRPEPPGASQGGCRARRSPRRLRPPDPARGEAIRHEDGVRRVCATLRSRRMKRHTGTPPDSRQIRTFARGRRCINIEIDRYTLII